MNRKSSYTASTSSPSPQLSSASATATTQPAHVRYYQNLKVLRRRDASIVSIMDSFSMVTVYRYLNGAWVTDCDGPMFLFEASDTPRYGLCILNRSGHTDFMLRLRKDHQIKRDKQTGKDFFMVKPTTEAEDHTPMGFWSYTEATLDVLEDLYEYIRQGEEYPAERRYGPDRSPPITHSSRGRLPPGITPVENPSEDPNFREYAYVRLPRPSFANGANGSNAPAPKNDHLEQLFANMSSSGKFNAVDHSASAHQRRSFAQFERDEMRDEGDAEAYSADESDELGYEYEEEFEEEYNSVPRQGQNGMRPLIAPRAVTPANSQQNGVQTTPKKKNKARKILEEYQPPRQQQQRSMSVESLFAALSGGEERKEPKGIPLLDSIFASASASTAPPAQVLTPNVLASLLGMPRPAHEEDDAYSTSSTVLDLEAEEEVRAAGASAGVPILATENTQNEFFAQDEIEFEKRHVNGDATPRPFTGSEVLPSVTIPYRTHSYPGPERTSEPVDVVSPAATHTGLGLSMFPPPAFSFEPANSSSEQEEDVVLELDFSDTRALSDMRLFEQVKKKRSAVKLNGHRHQEPVASTLESVVLQTVPRDTVVKSKKEFIRDLLTLIHTDSTFVNSLYEGYVRTNATTT